MSENKSVILLVEDDQNLNHAITINLQKKGVQVASAADAEEAFKVLESGQKADFIWLDLLLPGMNGLDFLRKIKQDERFKNIPVAVVSVSGGPDTQNEAKKLGAVDYLVKSEYKLDDLADKIIGMIGKS